MIAQLSLFDVLKPVAIRRPIDPNGHVIQKPIDEVFTCPGLKRWQTIWIEIHKDRDSGLFMWAVRHFNGGYRVGAKWGKFASTRNDALYLAKDELRDRLDVKASSASYDGVTPKDIAHVRKWLEVLQ